MELHRLQGVNLFLLLMLSPVIALIGTDTTTLNEGDMYKIDSFSFEKGGTFSVSVTTTAPTNLNTAILALIIESGEDCNEIAKHCTYKLLKSSNACSLRMTSSTFDNVVGLFPIMVPSDLYQSWHNTTTVELNVSSWMPSGYMNLTAMGLSDAKLKNTTLEQFMNLYVTPTVVTNIENSIQVFYTGNATNPLQSIVSNIEGGIGADANLAVGLISCVDQSA